MSRNQRLVLLGVAAAIAVVAVVLISSRGSDTPAATSGAATITVKDAKPVGGIKKVTYNKGDTIDLTIKSDTADEVHFHGYDVHKDVTKGGSVRFKLPATITGRPSGSSGRPPTHGSRISPIRSSGCSYQRPR